MANLDQNKYTQYQYAQLHQKLLPPGQVFPRRENTYIFSLLLGLSGEFKRVDDSIRDLVANFSTEFISTMIEQWEIDLGLPDDIQEIPVSVLDRIVLIRQRLIAIHGYASDYGINRQFLANIGCMLGQQTYTDIVQAETITTITLSLGASIVDDYYNDMLIKVINSSGNELQAFINDYDGTTKVCTLDRDLVSTNGDSVIITLMKIYDGEDYSEIARCGLSQCGDSQCGGLELALQLNVEAVTNGATINSVITGMFTKFIPIATRLELAFTL